MTHCTENYPVNLTSNPVGLTDSLLQVARQWIATQRLKIAIQRERAQLLTMSDAMLRDIGIDHARALHEARCNDIPAERNC